MPLLGAVAIMAILAASSANAGGSAQAGLTIAILDLAEIPALAPPKPVSTDHSAWRTSFGAERKSEPKLTPSSPGSPLAAIADADAVLIQGVHAAAPLRRMFPPSTWRLIVSRGLASPENSPRGTNAHGDAATAIAIKARSDLRVTARTAGLSLETPDAQAALGAPQTTATAVRLVDAGRAIWLASVTLPVGCGSANDCPARQQLNAWRATKRGDGELTVVGGRTQRGETGRPPAPERSAACAAHGIDADSPSKQISLSAAEIAYKSAPGCISMIRLDAPPEN
jgi:hypothetical protein